MKKNLFGKLRPARRIIHEKNGISEKTGILKKVELKFNV